MACLGSTGNSPDVSLTDGYPILIANEASLEVVNHRLKEKQKNTIPMSRFRPNIVVEGMKPWAEFDLVGKSIAVKDGKDGRLVLQFY